MIRTDNLLEIPTLVAHDVVDQTRRSYLVRLGDATLSIPKDSRDVYTEANIRLAIADYNRHLNIVIRRLEDELAEGVRAKRGRGIDVRVYDHNGRITHTTLSKEGRWGHSATPEEVDDTNIDVYE